jgi:hypothetical protein
VGLQIQNRSLTVNDRQWADAFDSDHPGDFRIRFGAANLAYSFSVASRVFLGFKLEDSRRSDRTDLTESTFAAGLNYTFWAPQAIAEQRDRPRPLVTVAALHLPQWRALTAESPLRERREVIMARAHSHALDQHDLVHWEPHEKTFLERALDVVERVGNKFPHPVVILVLLIGRAIGGLLVIMIWMNTVSQVLFYGAELCKVVAIRDGSVARRNRFIERTGGVSSPLPVDRRVSQLGRRAG